LFVSGSRRALVDGLRGAVDVEVEVDAGARVGERGGRGDHAEDGAGDEGTMETSRVSCHESTSLVS